MNLYILSQYKLIQQLYRSKEAMDILLDIDDFFDVLNLYAFPNWIDAEVVSVDSLKYFTVITIKSPYEKMPHPKGAVLLTKFDCKVEYKETTEAVIRKVISAKDTFVDATGERKPKVDKKKCWCITIMIPKKHLVNDGVYDIKDAEYKMKEDEEMTDDITADTGMPDTMPEEPMPSGEEAENNNGGI